MQEFLQNNNLTALWQPAELLMVRPPKNWELMWGYITFIALFTITAIALLFLKKKVAPVLYAQLSTLSWTVAILGGLLFFFRYVRIPYLGTDIVRTILEVSAVIWLIWISISYKKLVPVMKQAELIEERRTKYLPKPKK